MNRSTARPGQTTRAARTAHVRALTMACLVALSLVCLVLTSGCATQTAEKPAAAPTAGTAAAFPVTVTDDASRTVTIDSQPQRIVSLAPANTEILFALGLGEKVAGVTTYCDYPAEAKEKPKVGDFVGPNLEAVAAARPDLVLATGGVQADVIAKLEDLGAKVVVLDPQSVDDVRQAIQTTGKIAGATDEADRVTKDLDASVKAVEQAAPEGAELTRAFIEIGQNPLFTAGPGTLLDDMVRLALGKNVVTQPGYVAYSLEQLTKENPEVYLATEGSMSDPSDLAARPGYNTLAAVKADRVYVLDDNLVTRPGPRIGEGLLSIAKALHPDWDFAE